MPAKSSSPIEVFRKPISRTAALLFLLAAVFTTPAAFDSVAGAIMEMSGFVLLIIAALGRVWCAIYISGRKDRELCTEGPYSLTRNPPYFFSLLGVVGFSTALESAILIVVGGLTYLLYYRFVIRSEEGRLRDIFGSDYAAYQKSTPRFFPACGQPQRVTSLTVNPSIVERALKEVVWFLLAIVFVEIIERIHQSGHLIHCHLPL